MSDIAQTEADLAAALRAGDEAAFAALVDRYGSVMTRVAYSFVGDREVAAEVVQDTWVAVLQGIDRFEGRSSVRTWVFRILTNIAKTRGIREHRSTPVSALPAAERVVPADRFLPDDHPDWPQHWQRPPQPWPDSPEESLLSGEVRTLVHRELDRLPPQQRVVVSLCDVDGYDAAEVCMLLDLTPANQRVLLHRGRARIRQALEDYYRAKQ